MGNNNSDSKNTKTNEEIISMKNTPKLFLMKLQRLTQAKTAKIDETKILKKKASSESSNPNNIQICSVPNKIKVTFKRIEVAKTDTPCEDEDENYFIEELGLKSKRKYKNVSESLTAPLSNTYLSNGSNEELSFSESNELYSKPLKRKFSGKSNKQITRRIIAVRKRLMNALLE